MARTKVVEQKQHKPKGAGKAAKTLAMKKNLEAKAKDVVKKAPRHRHGVARAILAKYNITPPPAVAVRPVVTL